MLKPKDINPDSGGAFGLADMMREYTSGMDITQVLTSQLKDAPSSWNFFKPLAEDKFIELCESISEKGLIHPLIAFEDEGGRLVILSGHNRKRAYDTLYQATADEQYLRIACVIKRGITEEEARALLVDANWVQRTLSPSERSKAILYKYANLGRKPRGDQNQGKRTYDLVAEHFGLKATQVYQYTKLATLPEDWLQQVDNGKLSIKAAVYLAGLDDAQKNEIALLSGDMPYTALVNRWRKQQEGTSNMRTIKREVPEEIYAELMDFIDQKIKEFYSGE